MLTISSNNLVALILALGITLLTDFFVALPIHETYVPCPVWLMRYVTGYEMQPTMAVIWMTVLLYVIIRYDLRGLGRCRDTDSGLLDFLANCFLRICNL